MALAKHFEEIVLRRAENGARVVFEYQHPPLSWAGKDPPPSGWPPKEREAAYGLMPEAFETFRAWVHRATKECKERLAQEKTVLFELNEERTMVTSASYVSKAEAAETVPVLGGDLLDLDGLYGGLLVRGRYLFVSDAAVDRGIRMYGTELNASLLINELLKERLAA